MVETDHSSPVMLARRMLYNHDAGKPPRPQPVVLLLGPVGSGKSHALSAVSAHLGWGVVHSRFTFDADEEVPVVEVLVRLAYGFSRKWRHRAKPRFLRFTIALIAIGVELGGTDRGQDKQVLRERLREFKRGRWTGQLDTMVELLADAVAATNLVPAPFVGVFAKHLPRLVQSVAPRLGGALRSLTDFPRFEGGDAFDALVDLNSLAHQGSPPDPEAVTAWLTEAFLADVRENHRRMSGPELRSPCDCVNVGKTRHLHNWVVLLDDVDHAGGEEFLAALTTARTAYRRRHPEDPEAHDPLLVMATSGRWSNQWEPAWRPPWKADCDGLGTVPSCYDASYSHWAAKADRSPYYPVLLDALRVGEIADILGKDSPAVKTGFVKQATGGLPLAVESVKRRLGKEPARACARDMLGTDDPVGDPWYSWLKQLGLVDRLSPVDIDNFVTAAPFATAPWLIPLPATGPINQPHVARILTELRTAFWVTVPETGGGTADYAMLHPWIAANLVSALARRGSDHGPTYADQFTALQEAPDNDSVRQAYCRLALGDVGAVVDLFEETFDRMPHQDWVDRLTIVVRAPDSLPLDRDYVRLYDELVKTDSGHQPVRSPVRNNLARLVSASWLTANPFAVRGPNQNSDIKNAFTALAGASQLADLTALDTTGALAHRGLWP